MKGNLQAGPLLEGGTSRTLLIGGDVCPINANEGPFRVGDKSLSLDPAVLSLFTKASHAVVNLECPLIDETSPVTKTGVHLGAPREAVAGLAILGLEAVSLANNHIMDHGVAGLRTTFEALQDAGIKAFGAGLSASEAARPHEFSLDGVPVTIFTAAEHEFSIATHSTPGANGIDPARIALDVSRAASSGRFVVVLLHAGKEYHPYPPPSLRRFCEVLVDAGASCIICQHSHCMGAIEHIGAGVVFYGQGNLLFDWHAPRPHSWNEGFLIELSIDQSRSFHYRICGVRSTPGRPGAQLLDPQESEALHARLRVMGDSCADQQFLMAKWREFCAKKASLYLGILRGHGRYRRAVAKLAGRGPVYRGEQLSTVLNVIRCESHREALLRILEDLHDKD